MEPRPWPQRLRTEGTGHVWGNPAGYGAGPRSQRARDGGSVLVSAVNTCIVSDAVSCVGDAGGEGARWVQNIMGLMRKSGFGGKWG